MMSVDVGDRVSPGDAHTQSPPATPTPPAVLTSHTEPEADSDSARVSDRVTTLLSAPDTTGSSDCVAVDPR
jgi:hypothetical protein